MADQNSNDGVDGEGQKRRKPGYRSPPPEHQFQPGKSGNPRGRPKGAKGLKAELKEELDEFVTIPATGKRIRRRRLIIKALAAKASMGDVRAADKLLSLVIQAQGFEDERPAQSKLTDTEERVLQQFFNSTEVPVEKAADESGGNRDDEGEPDVNSADPA